jgi:hypothetical protein
MPKKLLYGFPDTILVGPVVNFISANKRKRYQITESGKIISEREPEFRQRKMPIGFHG